MADKVIMDTNVPVMAANSPQDCKEEELDMQRACVEYLYDFVRNADSKLVMDRGYEIAAEYRRRIPKETNVGRIFWKWFNTYMGKIDLMDYVTLEKDSEGDYIMFPLEERTKKEARSFITAKGEIL